MTEVIDVERAVVRVCFGKEAAEADLGMLGDVRVWRIYREMVRRRLLDECRRGLKRTAHVAGDAFERALDAHLAEDPPHTRFFREVVTTFAARAMARFRADTSLPPYLVDLCAWEAALWEVGDLDDRVAPPVGEFAFDRVPVLAPALRLLHLQHAIHEKPDAHGCFPAREAHLCVHRRAEEPRARTWALDPLMHALLTRFERGEETVTVAIERVAREHGKTVDAKFVDGLCTVLADCLEHGVVLGSR